jgi:predicted ATP-grasp superfamily ATP-dependent carboligase
VIPGLAGYVGIDLLLPDGGDPLIVEINPRLTTSYVGYRRIYSTPIPQRWLSTTDTSSICENLSIEWDVSSMP